ncbi:unnamed protein product [Bursaphelenchus xylophilus]|uniref:(pine wood nematode) hypothetical protein n=1 Tax=Bursaphelenchus xylophilus TaxID=6326 RepID=A0A1I7SF03_BURXY|nr:unnamed protein product [Bursaphelenchus xylophilus]CAG9088798.1 unnamed protein product [Bursaphelenchus xylophilus]
MIRIILISAILTISPTFSFNFDRFPMTNLEIGRNIDKYSLYLRPNAVYLRTGNLGLTGDDVRIPSSAKINEPYSGPAVIYIKFERRLGKTAVWRFVHTVQRELVDGNIIRNGEYVRLLPAEVRTQLLVEHLNHEKEESAEENDGDDE